MKKVFLFVAVAAALAFGGTSCKNAKMRCWEYTISCEGDSEVGYVWNTQDYMDYNAAIYKREKCVFSYKKSMKFKTPEDCIDANRD